MGSIRTLASKGTLFMDFRFAGQRLREYTVLTDTPANRKRLQKAMDRIDAEIAVGTFDYAKTFGKPLSASTDTDSETNDSGALPSAQPFQAAQAVGFNGQSVVTPTMAEFANQWYCENEITWRRSYRITQRGVR